MGRQSSQGKAIDAFIKELGKQPTGDASPTPDPVLEWINYAVEDLKLGEVENAKRSLSQALRIAKGEGETVPKPYVPPPLGTAAPLVDEVVARRKENRIRQDDFFSELRQIAQRCGFNIFKRLKDGRVIDQWYATPVDNAGKEVWTGNDSNLIDWLKKQNLKETK